MFTLIGKQQLSKAIQTAHARRPRVSFRGFGRYVVTGTARDYVVRCFRQNGRKVVDCACVAGQHGGVCYHAAAALALHVAVAKQRAH